MRQCPRRHEVTVMPTTWNPHGGHGGCLILAQLKKGRSGAEERRGKVGLSVANAAEVGNGDAQMLRRRSRESEYLFRRSGQRNKHERARPLWSVSPEMSRMQMIHAIRTTHCSQMP